MHEVLSIQVGQCGNQVGTEFWKRLASEHSIAHDGSASHLPTSPYSTALDDRKDRFFYQTDDGRYVPRALLVDLEPRVISHSLSSLFSEDCVFISNEGGGAGNNWAHGYYAGNRMKEDVMEMVAREAEACDNMETVYLMHSIAGGTGSGFGSFLLGELREMFPKKIISSYSIMPTSEEGSDVVVQPYNSVLTLNHLQRYCDTVTLMDNHSLGCIAMDSSRVKTPSYNMINSLVAAAMAYSNRTIRFPGHTFCDSRSILSCVVPVPSFRFLLPSYTPFVPEGFGRVQRKTAVGDVMRKLLQPKARLCGYEVSRTHQSIALFNVLEGVEKEAISQVGRNVEALIGRGHVSFVDWMVPYYHVALSKRPGDGRVTGLGLDNTTGVASLLRKTVAQFDLLRRKNAFTEIYRKFDTELGVFDESREAVQRVIDGYEGCSLTGRGVKGA